MALPCNIMAQPKTREARAPRRLRGVLPMGDTSTNEKRGCTANAGQGQNGVGIRRTAALGVGGAIILSAGLGAGLRAGLGAALSAGLGAGRGAGISAGTVGAYPVRVLVCRVAVVEVILARAAVVVAALAVGSPGVRKRWGGEKQEHGKECGETTEITHEGHILSGGMIPQERSEQKANKGGKSA